MHHIGENVVPPQSPARTVELAKKFSVRVLIL